MHYLACSLSQLISDSLRGRLNHNVVLEQLRTTLARVLLLLGPLRHLTAHQSAGCCLLLIEWTRLWLAQTLIRGLMRQLK
jgi:hypothetical protein